MEDVVLVREAHRRADDHGKHMRNEGLVDLIEYRELAILIANRHRITRCHDERVGDRPALEIDKVRSKAITPDRRRHSDKGDQRPQGGTSAQRSRNTFGSQKL